MARKRRKRGGGEDKGSREEVEARQELEGEEEARESGKVGRRRRCGAWILLMVKLRHVQYSIAPHPLLLVLFP